MTRQTGLLRLRHLHETTEAKGEEISSERARFQRLAREDSAPRVVSAFNLFQTPPDLASRMASILGPCERILEPSAGLGRLYRAIRNEGNTAPVVLVEQSAECFRELYAITSGDQTTLKQGDFLTMTPDNLGLFDGVIMNPPFRLSRDIKHILHARQFLAPGGLLVALCADGHRQRAALQPMADTWEHLPPETFRSEGTRVHAALLTLHD